MHNESQPNDNSSVEEQVIVYLNSDTARQAIHKDIDNLGKNIETINALFDKVMRPLQAFDHQSPDGKSALATQWAAFRKEFNQYVNDGRDSATAASGVMDVYTEAVLGKVKALNCDVSTLMTEIGWLREEVIKRLGSAKDVHSSFSDLSNRIEDFKHKVELSMKSKGISGPLLQDLRNAFEDMDTLEKKVSDIPDELLDRNAHYLGRVATLVPNMSKSLSMLAPMTTLEAFRPILGEQMNIVNATILKDIGNVAHRIKVISDIWKSLRTDMTVLETDLSLYSGIASVAASPFLMEKIEASRAVCKALSQCLKLYVQPGSAA